MQVLRGKDYFRVVVLDWNYKLQVLVYFIVILTVWITIGFYLCCINVLSTLFPLIFPFVIEAKRLQIQTKSKMML